MKEELSEKIRIAKYLSSFGFIAILLILMKKREFMLAGGTFILWGLNEAIFHYLKKIFNKIQEQAIEFDKNLIQSQKLAAIGELSTCIAHEINNPLAIMGQELEWIRYLISSEENLNNEKILEIKDSIEELNKQIRRCSDVTHRLLSLARKTDLVFQETNVNEIVEDVVSLVEKEARLKGISVVRVLDNCIPGIMTDPPLLKQVLLNLCNNALYAVGENGRVVVRTGIQNKEVIIEVEDNGPGIPSELLGKVFDPFFTTKEPGKGTGLGLSISQNIVHKLGGTISVESEPSKGTIFQVRIPMEVSHGSK